VTERELTHELREAPDGEPQADSVGEPARELGAETVPPVVGPVCVSRRTGRPGSRPAAPGICQRASALEDETKAQGGAGSPGLSRPGSAGDR
jgi:hypothetical protein